MSGNQIEFLADRVSSRQMFAEARTLISARYWTMVGICCLGMFISSVGPMGILMGPMTCGIFICFFAMMRNEAPTFSLLFEGFEVFMESMVVMLILLGVYFGVGILSVLVAVGAVIVGGQPGVNLEENIGVVAVGIFLFFGLIIGVNFSVVSLLTFSWPLIVDRHLAGLEAAKLSARAVWANLGNVVRLMILNGTVMSLAVVACWLPTILVASVEHKWRDQTSFLAMLLSTGLTVVCGIVLLPIAFGSQAILFRRVFPETVSPGPAGENGEEPQPDLGGGGYQLDGGMADQGSADWVKDDNWE